MAGITLAKVCQLDENADRINTFTNGDSNTTYTTTAGAVVPSIQKALADKLTDEIWVSGTTYAQGQVVRHNGNVYYSIFGGVSGADPETSSHIWQPGFGGSNFDITTSLFLNVAVKAGCIISGSTVLGFPQQNVAIPNNGTYTIFADLASAGNGGVLQVESAFTNSPAGKVPLFNVTTSGGSVTAISNIKDCYNAAPTIYRDKINTVPGTPTLTDGRIAVGFNKISTGVVEVTTEYDVFATALASGWGNGFGVGVDFAAIPLSVSIVYSAANTVTVYTNRQSVKAGTEAAGNPDIGDPWDGVVDLFYMDSFNYGT